MAYALEDVPNLVNDGKYIDALRILYEVDHPLSYELFPRRSKNVSQLKTPVDVELSEQQIHRLRTFVSNERDGFLLTVIGFAFFPGVVFIFVALGLVQLYQLLTTNVEGPREIILLNCCQGVIALPLFLFLGMMLRTMYLVLKSDNYGFWEK